MQNFDNINWKYTKCIQVMPARMNKILDILEKNGYSRIDPDPGKKLVTARWKMYDHYFVTSRTGNDITIHVYFVNKYIALPIRYSTTYKFSDENIVRGGQAAPQIYAAFKRKAKKTFDEVYGYDRKLWEGEEEPFWMLKQCVPAPLNYADDNFTNRTLYSCYKGDVSSAYPFEAAKTLPTLKGMQIVKGKQKANDEFPFAFRPSEGTVEIYGEFDSAYFFERKEYKYRWLPDPWYPDDITILCKAADDNYLGDIFRTKYANRQKHPKNKSCMNSFIGFCHMNSCPRYAHIAAVVLARCNHRMLTLADELRRRGQDPALINVDSILWIGDDQPDLLQAGKSFGAFHAEHKNCEAIIASAKKYQILDADGTLFNTWSGCKTDKQRSLKFGDILYKDLIQEKQYIFDPEVNRFRVVRINELGVEIMEGIAK